MPYPTGFSAGSCGIKQTITMAGSRAYMGGYERFDVIEPDDDSHRKLSPGGPQSAAVAQVFEMP